MENLSGKVVKGYQLRELIGVGGYGSVYRAHQTLVDREVAIKIILPQYANRPYFIRHFEIEAQLIARLEHLHIVPLYDYWREPDGAYIVMRWLRGGNLGRVLRNGPLDPEPTMRTLEQLASALALAHRNGVIHQDLKAANILLDEDQNAYLSDFGIAKDLTRRSEAEQDDSDDIIRGSPDYVAPEQILSAPIDAAADIYSLGILLFEMLTGKLPFHSDDEQETLRRQLYEQVPPLQVYRPELPEEYNLVIQRATEKHPRRRYRSALHLAEGFRQFFELHQSGRASMGPDEQATGPAEASPPRSHQVVEISTHDLISEPVNPYKGLRAFQEADAADFFGRETLVERLQLRLQEEGPEARFLAIVGPSGSGKSSVVKAGLIPRLRRGELPASANWYIQEITPGPHPLEELASTLLKVSSASDLPLIEMLAASSAGLHQALQQVLPEDNSELFLFIDQFEEIFTSVLDAEQRAHFLDLLIHALLADDSRLRLVTTLRADFYDRPLLYSDFGDLMRQRTEVVLPLSPEELHHAIVRPAERVGLTLESGLAEEIVQNVSDQPSALPLLQYALTELFLNRQGDTLTRSAYHNSGGVSGALTRRADEIFMMMSADSKEATRQLFLRLVTLGEGTEDTRRRILQSELSLANGRQESMNRVIETFGKYRLLAFDREPINRAPTIEIAHEALIREWRMLRKWLDDNREDLRVQRQLATMATDWETAQHNTSFLATGARLEQFEKLATKGTLALTQREMDYVQASKRLRQQARRRWRMFIASLISLSIVAVGFAGLAFINQRQTEQARTELEVAQATTVAERDRADAASRVSRSRELAITALTHQDQFDLALLLAVEALQVADTFNARSTLLTLLQSNPRLAALLHQHEDWVRTVAFSPDGNLLASAGRDGLVVLWDVERRRPISQPLVGHANWVNALAFSPNGELLASASADNTVRLWDVATGEQLAAVADHDNDVWDVAFSLDGTLLASASADNTVRLWDVARQQASSMPPLAHEDEVYSLAFSPDGTLLATGGADNRVYLWDVATGEQLAVLQGHTNWVRSLAFSPDGALLISGGEDAVIRIWEVAARQPRNIVLQGHTDTVRSAAFVNDQVVISSGADGLVLLWEIQSGEVIDGFAQLRNSAVHDVAVHTGQALIAAASQSRTVTLWNLQPTPRLAHVADRLNRPVTGAVFDPDGRALLYVDQVDASVANQIGRWGWDSERSTDEVRFAGLEQSAPRLILSTAFSPDSELLAAAGNRAVFLHDVTSGDLVDEPLQHSSDIFSLAFSPDGALLAAGGNDGLIALWRDDPDSGWQPLDSALAGHNDRVLSLAFSPDGALLASGSRDNEIILWNVAEGTAQMTLRGHANMVLSLAFSPDGELLASGSRDNEIILWNVAGGTTRTTLRGHANWVQSLAFSPDGELLASGSRDHTIILWDVSERDGPAQMLGEALIGHIGPVNSVMFSPDGTHLASAGADGIVIRWDVGLSLWRQHVCQIVNRSLQEDEWERYLPELPYRATCPEPG